MVYCIIVIAILLWIITFVNCYEVCGVLKDGTLECCTNFKYEDGKCIECTKGWFGEECNQTCPNGFYGVGCKEACSCTEDQICDAQDGCVQNKTVDSLTIMESTNTEQQTINLNGYHEEIFTIMETTSNEQQTTKSNGYYEGILTTMETTSTEHQTGKLNGYHEGILWNHLYGVTLGVVVIMLVILLVLIHRKWKTIDQESESRHDGETEAPRSQAVELNKNTEESIYEEICEFDTGCSHTHTFSSDDISFSRSRGKAVNQVQQMKHTILHLDAIAR